MLYISYKLPAVGGIRNEKVLDWHIGNPVPDIGKARVVTFQADGHELEMILAVMHAYATGGASGPLHSAVLVTKGTV